MSDLDELYQSVILDHDRSPRNFREMTGAGCQEAEGYNPLCGDRFRVMVRVEDNQLIPSKRIPDAYGVVA